MNKLFVAALLFLPTVLFATNVKWVVYISTDVPHYYAAGERVLSSTDTVKILFPTNDDVTFSCEALKPYYFQPEGFPYPLVEHRYLVCDLGKDYAVATETGCGLRSDDVRDATLLLQTPKGIYGLSFQCANFIDEKEPKNNP